MPIVGRKSLALLAWLYASCAWAEQTPMPKFTAFAEVSSLSYSEASAAYQMYKNTWQDYPRGGHLAFTRNHLAYGARLLYFSVAKVQRYDLNFRFTPDTSKVLYYQGRKQDIPKQQRYEIELKAQQLAGTGVRLGLHSPKTWGIEAHAYLHLLNTKDLQEGQVSGVVVEGGELGYQGVGYIDYRFSQDKINILKQEIEAPVGKAALADLHLAWQYQQFSAKLHLEDLPLYYRWHGLGHKQGKVSTSLLGSSSATGTVSVATTEHNSNPMPIYAQLNLSYRQQNLEYQASLWRYGVATFPQFGAAYHFGAQQIGVEYEVISSKLIASYQVHRRYLQTGLRLGSDNPNAKMAHALELGAYLALGF